MELGELLIEVVGVSASGVLAPGPLFIANLVHGARQGAKAGLKMAYGHSVIEFPLIVLLAVGVVSVFTFLNSYLDAIGLVGGFAILGFAAFQILSLRKIKDHPTLAGSKRQGPFITGVALTALNPFFLVWWLTVGLKVIADSLSFGVVAGIVLVFGFHIWMDYAWLIGTAYFSSRGAFLLKSKYYVLLIFGLTGVLVYFGLSFIISSIA
ncbi:MAG: LysE family translocator [Nitrososphaera sp.]